MGSDAIINQFNVVNLNRTRVLHDSTKVVLPEVQLGVIGKGDK